MNRLKPNFAVVALLLWIGLALWPASANAQIPTVSLFQNLEATTEESDIQASVEFTVSRTGSSGNLVVDLAITGTATNGVDYQALAAQVTILSGSTFEFIDVRPILDHITDPGETVTVTVLPSANYTVGSSSTGTATISDARYISITATDPTAAEPGTDRGTFTFTPNFFSGTDTTIRFALSGTAVNGTDYNFQGAFILPAFSSSTTVNVLPIDDLLPELSETVTVTILDDPPNYFFNELNVATVTINDNEPATPVTVATNPPGLQITVDGTSFVAPQNFVWLVGSNHTIGVPSPQGSGGTRTVFTSWSDAGAQTHGVTAPPSPTTFTATFRTQHLLTTAVSGAGAITPSPSSPDGFYDSGTGVQLTAAPAGLFLAWSGDLSGSTNPQSVTMSAPRSVTATFGTAITVTTNPTGLQIIVDGTTLTAPQSLSWLAGSNHTIAVASPQGSGGTRSVFTNWSDGGTQTHGVVAPSVSTTFTATFTTQHLLTTAVSGAGTITPNPASPDGFYDSGTSVQLTAAPAGLFLAWSGDLSGSTNPQSVTMSAPRSVTATFGTAITVTTNPPGLQIIVDGATLTAPQSLSWLAGSNHTIAVASPQGSGGTRSVFTSWSDAGTQSHGVVAPSAATTFTATFTTQHLLTTAVSGAGTITPNPASPDGFYDSGTSVQLTAAPAALFLAWSGDLSGSTNPQSVTMSAPRSVTASFATAITVTTSPSGLQIIVDGATLTAPQNFAWIPGSNHTLSVASPQGSGGTRSVFTNWSDEGSQTHSVVAPSTATTFIAGFRTQHLLTTAVSGAGTITPNPASSDGFYNSGTIVQLTAAPAGLFLAWSGDLSGSTNPQSVTMSAPRSVTAGFSTAITVTTSPSGLQIIVDGATLASPQSFTWTPGSNHTIGVASPQGSGGTRSVFTSWSDGGNQSHSVVAPAAGTTFTASFKTQYLLTTAVSGAGTITPSPSSPDGFYDSGTSVQLTAAPARLFQQWSGDLSGSTNPQSINMNTAQSATATFGTDATVTTNPSGLQIIVDGVTLTAPQTFVWTTGSNHSIAAVSPQGSGGTRSVFTTWSDGGGQSHSVSPAAATTYTANFKVQHLLTTTVSPANVGGTVTANPTSADGFYDAGTAVQLTAAPANSFLSWSGDLSGTANPQSLVMNGPRSVTATFTALTTVMTSPPGLQIIVDGATLTAPQNFTWTPGSSHTISALSTQGSGATRLVFTAWSDDLPLTHAVTGSPAGATYNANFKTQYLLTTAVSPAGVGSVIPSPAAVDGFYDSGSTVQLTATAAFQSWSGDLSGSANPGFVAMTEPRAVLATFQPLPAPPTVSWLVPGTSNPIPGTLNPTQQQPMQVSAPNTYAAPVTGQLNLVFVPDAVNNADDPNVVFTTGGRTLNFTIPANSSLAQFQLPNPMVQAGTVAGTIRITATLQVGTADVTPSPVPVHQIVVNRTAPFLLDDVRVVRTPAGFDVDVSGYSTTREIRQAIFRFTPVENRTNLQTSELTIDVSNAATAWFLSAPSTALGGTFHYVQPFTVQGDVTDIGSISVTLVNTTGTSATRTGRF